MSVIVLGFLLSLLLLLHDDTINQGHIITTIYVCYKKSVNTMIMKKKHWLTQRRQERQQRCDDAGSDGVNVKELSLFLLIFVLFIKTEGKGSKNCK